MEEMDKVGLDGTPVELRVIGHFIDMNHDDKGF